MSQSKRSKATNPANDNAPIRMGSAAKNTNTREVVAHVYVGKHENMAYVPGAEIHATSVRKVWVPTHIVTNLPEALPILPEEIALIRGFMGDLVSRILANDNEPV